MVRYDSNDGAHIGPGVAAREVEKAMLLGKAGDPGFRMFEDEAVAFQPATGIGRQRLRAGIEDAALRTGAADDGRIDVQRAIVP